MASADQVLEQFELSALCQATLRPVNSVLTKPHKYVTPRSLGMPDSQGVPLRRYASQLCVSNSDLKPLVPQSDDGEPERYATALARRLKTGNAALLAMQVTSVDQGLLLQLCPGDLVQSVLGRGECKVS